MRVLCGCGASFMRSGLWNHQRRSDDPRCNPTNEANRLDLHDQDRTEGATRMDDTDNRVDDFEVDPGGDFFGNYEDYTPEELGLEFNGIQEENITHNENDDANEGSDNEETNENPLEPDRFPDPSLSLTDDNEASTDGTHGARRLRGGAEVELKNKPFAVKFTKGNAGAVYPNHVYHGVDGNASYISQIENPDNPFSPFSSRIEWEIAHWAKTRGPSSTAFTELMNIEGVGGIIMKHGAPD